jgi:hypothetical protein
MGNSSRGLTPQQFVEKWSASDLSERAAEHCDEDAPQAG